MVAQVPFNSQIEQFDKVLVGDGLTHHVAKEQE